MAENDVYTTCDGISEISFNTHPQTKKTLTLAVNPASPSLDAHHSKRQSTLTDT